MGRLVTTARGGGGYWGSSRSCSACASRASRACEECLKNGPSNSPTTRERTNQAARPIATHHHAFSSASPRWTAHQMPGAYCPLMPHCTTNLPRRQPTGPVSWQRPHRPAVQAGFSIECRPGAGRARGGSPPARTCRPYPCRCVRHLPRLLPATVQRMVSFITDS